MSKQEQSRRSIRLPQKTGINMNMREKRTGKYVTVIVGVCLILLCAGLVAKFGVIDQYRRLSDAQGAYTRVHQQYVDTETQLEDYDRILAEYRTYSMDWMTGSEDSKKNYVAVDRQDVLDLVESEMMPRGTVKSVTVRDDSLVVTMGGMTLDQISAMFARLRLSPIVDSVSLSVASTEEGKAATIMDFTVRIELRQPEEVSQ